MVDLDGTYAYNRIRSLNFEGSSIELAVYPNPAREYIMLQNPQEVTSMTLLGLNGQ